MTDLPDDPTAWLGDPIGMHISGRSTVYINVPPAERDVMVISLADAPTIDDERVTATSYVCVSLNGARGLRNAIDAAISRDSEEHADS